MAPVAIDILGGLRCPGYIWIYLDSFAMFGCIWIYLRWLDTIGHFWIYVGTCGCVYIYMDVYVGKTNGYIYIYMDVHLGRYSWIRIYIYITAIYVYKRKHMIEYASVYSIVFAYGLYLNIGVNNVAAG